MLRQVKSPSHQVTKSPVLKELFLSGLSAILLIFSFPKFNIEFLAWFGFVPLFFAIENKSRLKAFFISYLTGIVFWLGAIYWLVHVTAIGMIVLILYLALYFGIFGLFFSFYELRAKSYELILIPSGWVLLEYIRSHLFTGFPWALLGYSQYLNLPLIQIADITGVWGVSFLVMMVNVTIWRVTGKKFPIGRYILPFLLLFLSLGFGLYKLHRIPHPAPRTPIKISVIQGNIPQELKWDRRAQDMIIDRYFDLTKQAVQDRPDLIIWPEAVLPCVLEEEPLYFIKVCDFAKKINMPLLLGAVTSRDYLYYNSSLLVSSEGKLLNRYDKLHLVPFGEYMPLRKILRFLETIVPIGDFARGKEYTVFKIQNNYQIPIPEITNNFAVLICFEDLFPGLSRKFVNNGAEFLVNITNDAWFKRSSAPYQHFQASVFRAVENRVFLVRATNTGISGFIAPSGKVISLVQDKEGRDIFISGYDTQDINISKTPLSFYTKYGDIFILFCFIFVLLSVIYFV